jgi:hypothetical protein
LVGMRRSLGAAAGASSAARVPVSPPSTSHHGVSQVTVSRHPKQDKGGNLTVTSSVTTLRHGVVVRARELPGVRPWSRSSLGIDARITARGMSWPVVIETKTHRFPCQVVDISSNGAKVMTSARLQPGSVVRLQIIPPDGTRLRVGALVWRLDADGVAFLFARSIHHPFIRAA